MGCLPLRAIAKPHCNPVVYGPATTPTPVKMVGLADGAVSVKAHTMEGLGPVGEGKAMAAYATALVQESTR